MPLWFDDSLFPVIDVAFDPSGCTDDDIVAMLDGFGRLHRRGEHFAVLLDVGRVVPNARQRKITSDWEAVHREGMRRWNMGTAFVMESKLARGALTALRWVSKPITPEAVFATRGEAASWCLEQLDGTGVVVPRHVRDALASIHTRPRPSAVQAKPKVG